MARSGLRTSNRRAAQMALAQQWATAPEQRPGYITYTNDERIADLTQRISSSRRCGFGESYIAGIQAQIDELRAGAE